MMGPYPLTVPDWLRNRVTLGPMSNYEGNAKHHVDA
jgi:hypothetical protein